MFWFRPHGTTFTRTTQARCYEFRPCDGWVVIVVDSFVHTFCQYGHETRQACAARAAAATAYMASLGYTDQPQRWPSSLAMWDPRRKFSTGNGAFGEAQLRWLRDRLQHHAHHRSRVIMAGHCPIHPRVVNDLDSCAWDNVALLKILAESPAAVIYLAGHDHEGGYYHDAQSGVHHLTVPAVLQAPPGTNRFLTLDLHTDSVTVRGEGGCRVDPGQWYVSERSYRRYRDLSRPIEQSRLEFQGAGVTLGLRQWETR